MSVEDPIQEERWAYNITEEVASYEDAFDMFAENVEERFSRTILTVRPETSMKQAVELMQEHRSGCLLVTTQDGDLSGIMTERDVLNHMVESGSWDAPVSERMTSPVITAAKTTTIGEIILEFSAHKIRHLVITEGNVPEMVVSTRSIIQHLSEAFPRAILNIDPGNDGSFANREGG